MANENVLLVCPTKRKVRPEDNEDLQIVTQHADGAEKCFHPKRKVICCCQVSLSEGYILQRLQEVH